MRQAGTTPAIYDDQKRIHALPDIGFRKAAQIRYPKRALANGHYFIIQ